MSGRSREVLVLPLNQFFKRFSDDKRAIELDYMLSLFIFILSLAFTFVILTQYIDMKHAEVGEVEDRLSSIRILDDLTGSPGWLSGKSNWENYIDEVDLIEKVNDQSFFLGLRKNDRYYGKKIVIPDSLDIMQSAAQGSIDSTVSSLKDRGVILIHMNRPLQLVFLVETSTTNSSMIISGADANVTTHVGSIFVGGDVRIFVTDTRLDGTVRYDTVVIGGQKYVEGSVATIGGRNFTIRTIDQELISLTGSVTSGYLAPYLDNYYYSLLKSEILTAGINFEHYDEVISGDSSSLEFTLLAKPPEKFMGEIRDLSLNKINALKDNVSYAVAKAALGLERDFNIRITRKRDGATLLDFGLLTPADIEVAEREVDVEGLPSIMVVSIW